MSSWFIFTIATTMLWGLAELFYKMGAKEREPYAHLKISICVGAVMGIHAIYTIVTGLDFDFRNLIVYLPVSLCYILSMTLSYFGMRFIEESISDPIENTSGALCSVLCVVFLGDEIAGGSWIAIAVIVAGILGVGFLERNGSTDRSKKLGKKLATIAFAMPFCYAIIDAVGSFLDSIYLDKELTHLLKVTEDNIEDVGNTAYELTFLVVAIVLFIFLKVKKVEFNLPKAIRKNGARNIFVNQWDKIVAALCETAGQFTYVYAMSSNGKPEIAAPIISSGCIVSVLLAHIFLKEKLTWKQYIFIGLVIIGIVALGIMNPDA